jgi:predicted Zn-dependent protease
VSSAAFGLEALEQRLRENPRSPLFARLASLYLGSNRLEESYAICRTGVEHYPDYATGHLILGKCLLQLGQFEEARRELNRVLSLQPNCAVARVLLQESERVGEVDAAADEIVTPTLAEIYAAQGAYREAIRTYALLSHRKPEERGRFELRIKELEEKWRALGTPG